MNDITHNPIIEFRRVCKAFAKPSGQLLPVLGDTDLAIHEGEILGLVGRSGSGKSTVLRIAGGLMKPTSGEVLYCGRPLTAPAEGIASVFQTFALLPWLTVLENVESGLYAMNLDQDEVRRRALAAIDTIGLDGFQSAYPRELSGGMRQRVGFARAIVTEPTLLLMDEPFSALDVLTAEMLRTDFLDLWTTRQLPTKAVLIVTHNIEEAVLMCDRILVLASNPGRIAAEVPVNLEQPRNRLDPEFHRIVDELYSMLTSRTAESPGAKGKQYRGFAQALPLVSTNRIGGLIRALATRRNEERAPLAQLAASQAVGSKELFTTAEALHVLEFADLKNGSIALTPAGRAFSKGGVDERKRVFREHLLRFVPMAGHISSILDEREHHRAPRVRFESELEDHLSRSDAERTLRALTAWARYAELFDYDSRTRTFMRRPRGEQAPSNSIPAQ